MLTQPILGGDLSHLIHSSLTLRAFQGTFQLKALGVMLGIARSPLDVAHSSLSISLYLRVSKSGSVSMLSHCTKLASRRVPARVMYSCAVADRFGVKIANVNDCLVASKCMPSHSETNESGISAPWPDGASYLRPYLYLQSLLEAFFHGLAPEGETAHMTRRINICLW